MRAWRWAELQPGVGVDVGLEVEAGLGVEDAGADVEGLGRDGQALGDLLEDLGRRAAQATLDLGEIGVRDAGQLREAAKAQPRGGALLTDEGPEVTEPLCRVDRHGSERRPGR